MLCVRSSYHVRGCECGAWRAGSSYHYCGGVERRGCMLTSSCLQAPHVHLFPSSFSTPWLLCHHSFPLCHQLTLSTPAFPSPCPFRSCQYPQPLQLRMAWLHVTPSVLKTSVCGSLRKLNLTKEQVIHGLNPVLNKSLSTQTGLLKDGFRKKSLGSAFVLRVGWNR